MPNTSSRRPPPHVRRAITEIRAFHRLGQMAPRETSHGGREIETAAERLGTYAERLRKSRQLADPLIGYTREELDELIAQLREHDYGGRGWYLGVAHLTRLVSVPKARGQRARLQRELIAGEWSRGQLDTEIRRRFGRRKQGGRRRRVPEDREGLLDQVEHECGRWERWWRAVTLASGGGMPVEQLPRSVRRKLEQVTGEIRELRDIAQQAQ